MHGHSRSQPAARAWGRGCHWPHDLEKKQPIISSMGEDGKSCFYPVQYKHAGWKHTSSPAACRVRSDISAGGLNLDSAASWIMSVTQRRLLHWCVSEGDNERGSEKKVVIVRGSAGEIKVLQFKQGLSFSPMGCLVWGGFLEVEGAGLDLGETADGRGKKKKMGGSRRGWARKNKPGVGGGGRQEGGGATVLIWRTPCIFTQLQPLPSKPNTGRMCLRRTWKTPRDFSVCPPRVCLRAERMLVSLQLAPGARKQWELFVVLQRFYCSFFICFCSHQTQSEGRSYFIFITFQERYWNMRFFAPQPELTCV